MPPPDKDRDKFRGDLENFVKKKFTFFKSVELY